MIASIATKKSSRIVQITRKSALTVIEFFSELYLLDYRGILADVIVYIFAHLHRALRTDGKVLDIN